MERWTIVGFLVSLLFSQAFAGAMCQKACVRQYQACHSVCRDSCKLCSLSSVRTAEKNYRRYVHEKTVSGGIITRELQSFLDPLQCRKITCSCVSDYAVCTQYCTGKIQKSLQVAPVCG